MTVVNLPRLKRWLFVLKMGEKRHGLSLRCGQRVELRAGTAGKSRDRDYINTMPEMNGGPPMSSVRHAAPSSLSQKRDIAKAIMGLKPLDDSFSAAERRN
jgi:hypothetical protein